MISYINVHAVLDGRRNRAKASPSDSDTSQVSFLVIVQRRVKLKEFKRFISLS